jgi:hypothetical protein
MAEGNFQTKVLLSIYVPLFQRETWIVELLEQFDREWRNIAAWWLLMSPAF